MVRSIFLVSFASPFLSFISVLSFSSFLLFLSFPSRSFLFPLDPNFLNFPTINTKTHTLADIFSPLFFCFFLHPLSNLILALPSPSLPFFFLQTQLLSTFSVKGLTSSKEKKIALMTLSVSMSSHWIQELQRRSTQSRKIWSTSSLCKLRRTSAS